MLHASWNVLVKSSEDKALDTALIHLLGSVVAVPLVLWVGLPPAAAWPFLLMSLVIHVGYYTALAGAYEHGDMGLTYPLMRGLAPLLVAVSASFVLGEQLSPGGWVGVLAISAGVLTLGLSAQALAAPKAVAFALANAVTIMLYTLVDAHVAYRWDRPASSWEVFLDGSNLTDEEARPHTSLLRDYAPLPGRGVAFGIRAYF